MGIGGRRPAREIKKHERGPFRGLCSRRNIVWKAIQRMPDRGVTLPVTIAIIRQVYGTCSITQLIHKMWPDEKRGGDYWFR